MRGETRAQSAACVYPRRARGGEDVSQGNKILWDVAAAKMVAQDLIVGRSGGDGVVK